MNESDFNEHRTPNGGWRWYQPETKWRAPTPIASTLNQTCLLIQAMRRANPAITQKFKLSTDLTVIKSEVVRYNRKLNGLPEELTPSPFSTPHRYQSGSSAGAVGARISGGVQNLKRAAEGTAVILEWLGSGMNPVSQELAEKRAATCVQCPKNVAGSWFTEAPAELIKKAVETWKTITGKTEFEFKTEQGDKLKSCGVCLCLLPMKVFTPMEHILNKTKPEVMGELPSHCWIKQEQA